MRGRAFPPDRCLFSDVCHPQGAFYAEHFCLWWFKYISSCSCSMQALLKRKLFFCSNLWGCHTVTLAPLLPSTCCAVVLPGHHPLDPLTEEEVKVAAESCKQHAASLGLPALRFNTVTLQVQHPPYCLEHFNEPTKHAQSDPASVYSVTHCA
jgi:Cu2+-containing amine oxidase